MTVEEAFQHIRAKIQREMDLENDARMGYPYQKPIGFPSWTAWIREQEDQK